MRTLLGMQYGGAIQQQYPRRQLQLQPQFFAESLDESDVMFDFVKDKLTAPFFNGLNISSKRNTLDYLFYKIRSGYFLKIQNGKLKEFIPFYNVAFKNNWSHLLNIDKLLQKNNYIMGEKIQFVDIALFPFIRQFRMVNIEWFRGVFENIYVLYKKISNSQLFLMIMKKYDFWDNKNNPLIIDYRRLS